jgi:hypothetical protein
MFGLQPDEDLQKQSIRDENVYALAWSAWSPARPDTHAELYQHALFILERSCSPTSGMHVTKAEK